MNKSLALILSAILLATTTLGVLSVSGTGPTTTPARPKDKVVVDAATEELLKGAQRYLASRQNPNGSWTVQDDEHPLAMTAYTVMALLATGNLPNEGEYGKHVQRGVDFVLSCALPEGYLNSEKTTKGSKKSNMYDHGIATIMLGEVYGLTRDPKVKTTLEKSIKLIIGAQNQEGGWRYEPKPSGADISVTVLQVVALRAAKNAGVDVPQKTIDRAIAYVKSCYDKPSGAFTYQPRNNQPGLARTAAAIYSIQVCGIYDDPKITTAVDYLLKVLKDPKSRADTSWLTYGYFYAAPAMYMVGGESWETWYGLVNKTLKDKAKKIEGDKTMIYWEQLDGGHKELGTLYATAVYTHVLALPYHYVPLYQR
jgi:prenyltransferase beta subunit